jgi:ABC-type bacteriocin/lantibiotic exporter with double-glycine peptidase domain
MSSIEKFIMSLDKIYDVLTSVEKLGKVIDKPLEKTGTLLMDTNKGVEVEVRDLSFGYNADQPIIRNVNLLAPAGKLVCIAGREGVGKSTLLRLITGSFTEFSGHILINGIPIGNYDLDSLRQSTGIYFSQQEIFDGTLWENISLGDCAYTPQELVKIATNIGLGDFLAELPEGFNTRLDPMGRRLSKSTTHRILFLRAVSSKPSLLLLEEPWEGLDPSSRQNIVHFLRTEMKHTTILVASNDPEFMQEVDMVYKIGNA